MSFCLDTVTHEQFDGHTYVVVVKWGSSLPVLVLVPSSDVVAARELMSLARNWKKAPEDEEDAEVDVRRIAIKKKIFQKTVCVRLVPGREVAYRENYENLHTFSNATLKVVDCNIFRNHPDGSTTM